MKSKENHPYRARNLSDQQLVSFCRLLQKWGDTGISQDKRFRKFAGNLFSDFNDADAIYLYRYEILFQAAMRYCSLQERKRKK